MLDFVILHTNDLHGKLSQQAEEIIAREKKSCDTCILLDAGDAIPSGNIYWRPWGEPILSRMADIGYDAMVMGNREFHFRATGLESKVKLARFPVLSANIRCTKRSICSCIVPTVTFCIAGLSVAVLGLTVPMITKQMLAAKISPFWFENPISAAKDIVPSLRDNADIIIALTHIGLRTDMELAAAVSGIDIVVGGHSHSLLSEPVWVGDTAVVQAGYWGRYLGKTELTISSAGKRAVRTSLINLRD